MFCTNCGKEIKDGTDFCTNCGKKVKEGRKKKTIQIITLILFVVIISIIFIIVSIKEKQSNRNLSKDTSANEEYSNRNLSEDTSTNEEYSKFNISVSKLQEFFKEYWNGLKENNEMSNQLVEDSWITGNKTNGEPYYVTSKTFKYLGKEMSVIAITYTDENNIIQVECLTNSDMNTYPETVQTDILYLMSSIPLSLEVLVNDRELKENYADLLFDCFDNQLLKIEETKKGICFNAGKEGQIVGVKLYLEKYKRTQTNTDVENDTEETTILDTDNVNTETDKILTENNNNSNQNLYTSSNNSNSETNNKYNSSTEKQKEIVQVPYFDTGNKLEYYTKELDKLGIKYKVVKAQDLEYKDNTVIKVEHSGEYVEKGSTITITVADNTYKVNVYINTEFLVSKAGLGDKSLKEVSIILKINGQTVYNGKAPVSSDFYNRTYGQYKGKIDNFDIEVTVEGKKIKLEKLDYNYTDYYDNTPQIVINNFNGMG